MTAFDWGMLGIFLFFSLVTFWCLYSYRDSYRANQKLSGQDKPQTEELEGKHESKSQK